MLILETIGNQYLYLLTQQFLPRVAKELLRLCVYQNDRSGFVYHDHSIWSRLDGEPKLLLGLRAIGRIAGHAAKPTRRPSGSRGAVMMIWAQYRGPSRRTCHPPLRIA